MCVCVHVCGLTLHQVTQARMDLWEVLTDVPGAPNSPLIPGSPASPWGGGGGGGGKGACRGSIKYLTATATSQVL